MSQRQTSFLAIRVRLLAAIALVFALQGCLLGAAVNVAAETVEAGIELTGAVVGAAVDIVRDDRDDDDEEEP